MMYINTGGKHDVYYRYKHSGMLYRYKHRVYSDINTWVNMMSITDISVQRSITNMMSSTDINTVGKHDVYYRYTTITDINMMSITDITRCLLQI